MPLISDDFNTYFDLQHKIWEHAKKLSVAWISAMGLNAKHFIRVGEFSADGVFIEVTEPWTEGDTTSVLMPVSLLCMEDADAQAYMERVKEERLAREKKAEEDEQAEEERETRERELAELEYLKEKYKDEVG